MRRLILFPVLVAAAVVLGPPYPATSAAAAAPDEERAITHALNRLAFGPDPSALAQVTRVGLRRWIEQQLRPEQIPDAALDRTLSRLTTLQLDPGVLSRDYVGPAMRERKQRRAEQGERPDAPTPGEPEMRPGAGRDNARMDPPSEAIRRGRRVYVDLAEAKLLRAVYSERQLEEVLVDFWFNHFNVFSRKGPIELYLGEYEREAIRPHVLGRFRDLLGATAKSPAMLFYLDNWMSAAQTNASESGARARRTARGADPRRPQPRPAPQRARGLNENYARELLELHTLGVDGGYTQQDVVAVARAFTGWTIAQPRAGGGFEFRAAMHDGGEKVVLGHTIAAGGGREDGERVLDLVSSHPSTARHIAFKLAQRFVSDAPPPALVDRAAARFRATNGDLREVVRTIVTGPEFLAPEARQAKVKTPFELVASALRAAGAEVSSAAAVTRALAAMGMPLYLCQPPTGYDETADAWISSGALVHRINFALELAGGRLRGVAVPQGSGDRLAQVLGAPDFQKQ